MEATPKPKTFAELFEERKKYILKQGLPAGQSGLYIRTSIRPLSNISKKSIRESQNRRRRTLKSDLKDESIMVSEAIYMIGLYSGNHTKPYHTDDNTKINDILKALHNFKNKNKTDKYDGLLDALQRILNRPSKGGKRKTRKQKRNTRRS
jgi:hypothetical protein